MQFPIFPINIYFYHHGLPELYSELRRTTCRKSFPLDVSFNTPLVYFRHLKVVEFNHLGRWFHDYLFYHATKLISGSNADMFGLY